MRQFLNTYTIPLLVLLQLIICLPFIAVQPIALDEPFSIFHSQQDFPDLIQLFENENNPPLHFVLLHFWIKLFGIGAFSVRSLSLLFSLLTIPVLFKLTERILNKKIAVLSVFFFVFSSFHHFHALEARVYSLFVLLFVLILYDLHAFLFRDSTKWTVVRLAIWNALLLYAHYLGGFILMVELLMILVFFGCMNRRKWLELVGGTILILLLYLPGIHFFLIRMESFSSKGTWVPPAAYSELYGNILRFYNGKYAVLLMVGILFISWLYYRKKTQFKIADLFQKKEEVFIGLFFIFTYFGMFIISKLVEPIFLDRYLLFTSIPLYLTLLIIVNKLISNNNIMFFSIIPFVLFFKIIPDNDREPDQIAQFVTEEKSEMAILLSPSYYDLTFMYHYAIEDFKDYRSLTAKMAQSKIYPIFSKEEIEGKDLSNSFCFIDANSNFVNPNNGILKTLKEDYSFVDTRIFKGGITVYKFEK